MGLSEKVKQICKDHYTDCDCPIREYCAAPCKCTIEHIMRWEDDINEAAEKLKEYEKWHKHSKFQPVSGS